MRMYAMCIYKTKKAMKYKMNKVDEKCQLKQLTVIDMKSLTSHAAVFHHCGKTT